MKTKYSNEDLGCYFLFKDDVLNNREKQILYDRIQSGLTLRSVGSIYNVGPERIRQIEAKALAKCRHAFRNIKKEIDIQKDIIKDLQNNLVDSRIGKHISIEDLDISARTKNALINNSINDVSQLLSAYQHHHLQDLRGLGLKGMNEAADILSRNSLI